MKSRVRYSNGRIIYFFPCRAFERTHNPSGPQGHKSLVHIQSTRKQASLCLPDNKTHFSLPLDHGLYHIFSGSHYNNKKGCGAAQIFARNLCCYADGQDIHRVKGVVVSSR